MELSDDVLRLRDALRSLSGTSSVLETMVGPAVERAVEFGYPKHGNLLDDDSTIQDFVKATRQFSVAYQEAVSARGNLTAEAREILEALDGRPHWVNRLNLQGIQAFKCQLFWGMDEVFELPGMEDARRDVLLGSLLNGSPESGIPSDKWAAARLHLQDAIHFLEALDGMPRGVSDDEVGSAKSVPVVVGDDRQDEQQKLSSAGVMECRAIADMDEAIEAHRRTVMDDEAVPRQRDAFTWLVNSGRRQEEGFEAWKKAIGRGLPKMNRVSPWKKSAGG